MVVLMVVFPMDTVLQQMVMVIIILNMIKIMCWYTYHEKKKYYKEKTNDYGKSKLHTTPYIISNGTG